MSRRRRPSERYSVQWAVRDHKRAARQRRRATRRPATRDWRWASLRAGQVMLISGFLIFALVAYELWGTSFWTKRAQKRLRRDFTAQLAPPAPASPGGPKTPATTRPDYDAVLAPAAGEAVARMLVPKLDLDVIVVEGVEPGDLRDGPGHFPGTPLPGDDGNIVISGHRVTYGAPFHHLGNLAPGDSMVLQTRAGEFDYVVDWIRIVDPSDLEVTKSELGKKEVTLTTCHPKFSAAQRLIVRATQRGAARLITTPL